MKGKTHGRAVELELALPTTGTNPKQTGEAPRGASPAGGHRPPYSLISALPIEQMHIPPLGDRARLVPHGRGEHGRTDTARTIREASSYRRMEVGSGLIWHRPSALR